MSSINCSGALFYALDSKRFLMLHRVGGRNGNKWGLVGGTNEGEESPWEGLQREIAEEIGEVEIKKTVPLETFISNDRKFQFHTYLCVVENEFMPTLNHEHDGYCWVTFKKWPKPLHHGLSNTLNNKSNISKLETVIKLVDMIV